MSLQTEIRTKSGKGVARKLRLEDKIPAVLYGAGKEPQSIAIKGYDVMMSMQAGGFFTNMQELDIDGKLEKVLARDVQCHPVSEKIEHIDFMRYNPKQVLKVNVRIDVTGQEDSPGLEKGGVLQLLRNEIEVLCRADSIPDSITISMAGKDIGDSVHVSEADIPEGVKVSVDRDFTIASIVSTRTSTMTDLDEDGNEIIEGEEGEGAEGEEGEAAEGEKADGEKSEGGDK